MHKLYSRQKKGIICKFFFKTICIVGILFLQIFLVTGGVYVIATEILKDKKWTVLKHENGNLPFPGITGLKGVRLATLNNEVFSFGKI